MIDHYLTYYEDVSYKTYVWLEIAEQAANFFIDDNGKVGNSRFLDNELSIPWPTSG